MSCYLETAFGDEKLASKDLRILVGVKFFLQKGCTKIVDNTTW